MWLDFLQRKRRFIFRMKKWYGKQLLISETVTEGLKRFFKKIDPEAREKALMAWGLQLVNNVVLGQGNSGARPSIKTGRLRGSGTVFVGSKKVGDTLYLEKEGTPASSYTEKNENVITVGFNTPYAAIQHEKLSPANNWVPGGKDGKGAAISGGVEGKFLETHLKKDKEDLLKLYTAIYKKNAGT